MGLPFRKMHGLGNDFVVIDARRDELTFTPQQIRAIADRKRGIGCDQVMVIDKPNNDAVPFLRIFNPDGSEAEACGNGTRCVASLLLAEAKRDVLLLETLRGILVAKKLENDLYAVDMGTPRLKWNEIPLAKKVDTLDVMVEEDLPKAAAINMGNPHIVFFVPDAEAIDLPVIGPRLEKNSLFPEKANIEFAHIISKTSIRMRVWERSAGITDACGSAACATLVAAARRGLAERKAEIVLDGGSLTVEWGDDNHVVMTGPAVTSFTGVWDG
jgi:diaminopimelate epimerase